MNKKFCWGANTTGIISTNIFKSLAQDLWKAWGHKTWVASKKDTFCRAVFECEQCIASLYSTQIAEQQYASRYHWVLKNISSDTGSGPNHHIYRWPSNQSLVPVLMQLLWLGHVTRSGRDRSLPRANQEHYRWHVSFYKCVYLLRHMWKKTMVCESR